VVEKVRFNNGKNKKSWFLRTFFMIIKVILAL
jgi:hypothetical protein